MNGNCDCNEQLLCGVCLSGFEGAHDATTSDFRLEVHQGGSCYQAPWFSSPARPVANEYFMDFLLLLRLHRPMNMMMTWCEPKRDCISLHA